MEPSKEQIRAATLAKIQRACDAIQEAQNQLGTACGELSALMYGAPAWKKASKLYDTVHAFWYVVDGLRQHSRVTLDSTNVDGLRRALERKAAAPAAPVLSGAALEHAKQVAGDRRDWDECDRLEGMGGDAVLDRTAP